MKRSIIKLEFHASEETLAYYPHSIAMQSSVEKLFATTFFFSMEHVFAGFLFTCNVTYFVYTISIAVNLKKKELKSVIWSLQLIAYNKNAL